MQANQNRLKVWLPLLFSLVMIIGMVLGFNLRDSLRNKRDIQTVIERNDRLEQIIDLIKEKYVDTINTNLLYKDAVGGILSHLDPHTVYIAAEQLQSVNEDLEGSFFGIGVEFSILKDTIQVTAVVEDGPAERVGVETGDQLIKVGDSVVAGVNITSERIISMLRGKQYSKVPVMLKSAATGKMKNVIIQRDAIPLYSVEASIMLNANTGYIKINRFSATTFDEFVKAMDSLKAEGASSLILDLRQNPGGYLDAATSIADEFLDDQKLIVYTQGKNSKRREYKAEDPGMFEKGKLAILVDEGSASASEVLAGAIQDWDRGVILGRRTFGKGLVQEQFELGDGSALRLTIAKYYTPSGRSIQRSYANGREAYAEDYAQRYESGELTGIDTTEERADTIKYYTADKRIVYGGGGITPDIYVPYDTSRFNNNLMNIIFSEEFRNTLWYYFMNHRAALKKYTSVAMYKNQFNVQDLEMSYLNSLPKEMNKRVQRAFRNKESKYYFELQLKAQLARFLFRDNGYYSVFTTGDHMVQKALDVFKTDVYSKTIGR